MVAHRWTAYLAALARFFAISGEAGGPQRMTLRPNPDGSLVFGYSQTEDRDAQLEFLAISSIRLKELEAMIAILGYAAVSSDARTGIRALLERSVTEPVPIQRR
ncbi:hypothetical protein EOS_20815 [Caballeronia mineralivorans PML1(12)]|uniref:Uncharacterized protein n=1 Tax=Caballeronia mineralivorans PML1(12) TaxID=908627 RepID=A0A0J1CUM4_9BURK|nr:hypothetical protein EOS_20815 [Caballeronia mineralivorans PML1(12)]